MTPPDHNTTMRRRLRAIRTARGKSLTVVAGLAGISKSCLSMLERGRRPLDRLPLIFALANALEVSPAELINLDGDNGSRPRHCELVLGHILGTSCRWPAGAHVPSKIEPTLGDSVSDAIVKVLAAGEGR